MAADRKAIRTSIQSITATLHLTKAMGLVASSKMRRANENMMKSRQYVATFKQAMDLLTASHECEQSAYFGAREGNRTRLIVIAGDRGLAGGYNNNVFRLVAEMNPDTVIPIGRRACDKYHGESCSSERYSPTDAEKLVSRLCQDFLAGEYDRLGIVYTKYVSVLTQTPEVKWILPLVREEGARDPGGVIFEPDEKTILDLVVPEYLTGLLCVCLRESFASEVASRRNAMDSAGKNAEAMIDDLTLAYNRARQGAITQEITEIVAGSNS